MKQRWFESANDVKFRQMAERKNLNASELYELRDFLNSSGSAADRFPMWVNWLIGVVLAIYFGGGLIAPLFWKL